MILTATDRVFALILIEKQVRLPAQNKFEIAVQIPSNLRFCISL
jgi:hypothetical protein